ncbi:MAG: SprT-like domain-containing protein [Planctomycetota bacterium]
MPSVVDMRLSEQQLENHCAALQRLVASTRVSEDECRRRWYAIGERVLARSRVMKTPNFTLTNQQDLEYMAELYDQYFFNGHCLMLARHYGMKFRWSKRMTSTGGKTVRTVALDPNSDHPKTRYEIVLSATLLFQTFADIRRPIRVTGILCSNRLQAMQRILEHELIHLVEMLVWEDSCCASPRFQSIAARLFAHTEHKHDLITQRERAASKFNIRIGTHVAFQHQGTTYRGLVNRITRRATVLVVDPTGQLYDDGQRYRKYYVPVSHLRPAIGA